MANICIGLPLTRITVLKREAPDLKPATASTGMNSKWPTLKLQMFTSKRYRSQEGKTSVNIYVFVVNECNKRLRNAL